MSGTTIENISNLLTGSKVYNRYQQSDFKVGADNLNPVREIDTSAFYNLEEARLQIYMAYKKRIEDLQAAGVDVFGSTHSGIGAFPGAATDMGLPFGDRVKVSAPMTMREASPSTEPALNITKDTQGEILQLLGALEGLLGSDALSLDDLPIDLCADRGLGGFASTSSSSSSSGSSTGNSQSATQSLSTNSPAIRSITNSATAAECLQLELEWLAMILSLLNILQVILSMERYIMSVVWPIINLIVMVCSVWLNPSELAKIMQYLAGLGVSALIQILTDTIKKLIDSLNLDCLLDGAATLMAGVLGTLGGVTNAGSELKSFVDFNKNTRSELTQAATTISASVSNAASGDSNIQVLQKEFVISLSPGLRDSLGDAVATVQAEARKSTDAIIAVGDAVATMVTVTAQTSQHVGDFFGDGYQAYE